jgi:hypothetical protein
MTIVITAFERSPDGGKGLARDTRVRWALEEVGQPYEVRLVSFRAIGAGRPRGWQTQRSAARRKSESKSGRDSPPAARSSGLHVSRTDRADNEHL